MGVFFLKPQRIEVGGQVAAHAIGADHHQGAHGIARGRKRKIAGEFDAHGLGASLNLGAKLLLDRSPVAIKGADQLAIRRDGPPLAFPRWAFRLFQNVFATVVQIAEEGLPAGVDRSGILLILRVKIFDIVRIRSMKERRAGKQLVEFLP